jgi:hypothetical protein
MVWQNGYDTAKKELQRENERLRAALDGLAEAANSVVENNYAPDPSLIYDVRRWRDLIVAIDAAKEAAPDG